MQIEPRTLLATGALAALVTAVAALVPALKATRSAVVDELRQGARLTSGSGRQRLRMALATVQVALTIALFTAAGLTVSGLQRVTDGPFGFAPSGVLTATATLAGQRYATAAQQYAFTERVTRPAQASAQRQRRRGNEHRRLQRRFRVAPVLDRVDGADGRRCPRRRLSDLTPGWLDVMRVPLLRGRALSEYDRADAPPVALVSESLARQFWPAQDPIGRRFRLDCDGPLITTVGVVGDVARHWLFVRLASTVYSRWLRRRLGMSRYCSEPPVIRASWASRFAPPSRLSIPSSLSPASGRIRKSSQTPPLDFDSPPALLP